jgi:ADP-ribosyl-[dinitrogen reductase] hydrolase
MKDLSERLRGVLLGTAVGDALGLPMEGMSAPAIARSFPRLNRFQLLGRRGFVSDDTEQSALVAESLLRAQGSRPAFERAFRRALLGWFLRLPWGIGWGTLRACARIALGLQQSGVSSAGNGAAMRAAVVGVALREDATSGARGRMPWPESLTPTRAPWRARASSRSSRRSPAWPPPARIALPYSSAPRR